MIIDSERSVEIVLCGFTKMFIFILFYFFGGKREFCAYPMLILYLRN